MLDWRDYTESVRSKVQVRKLAARVLADCDAPGPSTDIRELVQKLGITLIDAPHDPASPDLSGAAVMKDGQPFILVNESHRPERQRFTIAHELGHLLMHVSTGKAVLFRDDVSARGVDPFEVEANAFAAALLMPEERVRRLVPEPMNPMDDDGIERLAKRFEVSGQAMAIRLKSLGLLQA